MAELLTFDDGELPAELRRQILAAHRREWPQGFAGPLRSRDWIQPARFAPNHFLLVDLSALVSYVGVVAKPLEHAGETYRTYGLSGVWTDPASRRQGHGRRLVAAATERIRGSNADIGLFVCPPARRGFYEAAGWTPMDAAALFGGPRSNSRRCEELTVMGFFSEKGERGRRTFAAEPIFFDDELW